LTARTDITHMRLAIQEARRSRSEDERTHPYVGVVIVRKGHVLASACRSDLGPGDHAEFGALEKKLQTEALAGCTVYTTLEPCTTRQHPKVACAGLIERRVGRVMIGMLDPDQRITGKGVLKLRQAGIAVDLFPPGLMAQIEELNREFIREREAQASLSTITGVAEAGLTAFYPCRDYYSRFRRDASTIDRYVSTAETTAILVSINLMTGIPFHDLCAALERKLSGYGTAFSATVSLLDPRCPHLMNVIAAVLSIEPDDLALSIRKSLRDLVRFKGKLPEDIRSRFDIRVHSALPFGSAILLDHKQPNGRIQIETKPYKAGLQKSFAFARLCAKTKMVCTTYWRRPTTHCWPTGSLLELRKSNLDSSSPTVNRSYSSPPGGM
jgi:pyrimidine deaminase RibD-like protein